VLLPVEQKGWDVTSEIRSEKAMQFWVVSEHSLCTVTFLGPFLSEMSVQAIRGSGHVWCFRPWSPLNQLSIYPNLGNRYWTRNPSGRRVLQFQPSQPLSV
jgi:hypothetical protein